MMATFQHLDELLKQFAGNTVPGCGCAVAQNGKRGITAPLT